jgi:hypothetical protein
VTVRILNGFAMMVCSEKKKRGRRRFNSFIFP